MKSYIKEKLYAGRLDGNVVIGSRGLINTVQVLSDVSVMTVTHEEQEL